MLMSNTKEDKMLGTAQPSVPGQNFNVEVPANLPIVYTDMVHMTTNDFGIVFDFGQRMGPTNKVNVVARVGMSRDHAVALLKLIEGEIKKGK